MSGTAPRYFGLFANHGDVVQEFRAGDAAPPDEAILLASYVDEDYTGDAFVLYQVNGKLYEVNGSHCSCNGLEDQWSPEETTWAALAHRRRNGSAFDRLGDDFLAALDGYLALHEFKTEVVSLETWKKEYYPVPAHAVSREDALDHSIRKWEGLRPENLERHGLRRAEITRRTIVEKDGLDALEIDAGSCALCHHHERESLAGICRGCPLYLVRGARCDTPTDTEALSPYQGWLKSGSPVAMLELLDAAKAAQSKEAKS